MNSPPDAAPLVDVLSRFAAALRMRGLAVEKRVQSFAACIVDDGISPAARVQVYRNNGQAMFDGALARTYPVLKRRVGDGHFARLATEYREMHPSHSGDLHWVGASFPAWMAARTEGTDYAWLADLARLEWACEEALVVESLPAVVADALARVPPDDVVRATFTLQPGLRLVGSPFSIWSVWQANQPELPGEAVDLSVGAQHVAVVASDEGLVLHSLPLERFRFVEQLALGRSLGDAVDESRLAVESLAAALAWLFSSQLVTSVTA